MSWSIERSLVDVGGEEKEKTGLGKIDIDSIDGLYMALSFTWRNKGTGWLLGQGSRGEREANPTDTVNFGVRRGLY